MPQNKRKFVAWRLRLTNGAREASHSELENADKWLESSETVFGAMVFFGVAFEVIIAAQNPPYGSPLERWGSCVADAFVALGVLGELLASARGRIVQGELTRRSAAELADAKKVAGSANERAAQAALQAEQARERTAQLEQRVAGRSLSADSFIKIVDLFRSLDPKPQRPVIEFVSADPEAYSFATELQYAFWQAGLKPRMKELGAEVGLLMGIWVGDVPPGRGWAIMNGLLQAGIGSFLIENAPRWDGLFASADLYVCIGKKPIEPSKNHVDRLFNRAER